MHYFYENMKLSRNRILKYTLYAIFTVFVVVFCQCVYFNLFYNAQAAYDTARTSHKKLLKDNPDSVLATIPSDIGSNYDRAIDKATKVLEEYPKKVKWHDDAIFLMGEAHFYKGDYDKTVHLMAELQDEFPGSPFIPQSFLYQGKAYLFMGSLDKAEQIFSLIMEKYPGLNENEQISLLIAELALKRDGKAMAIELLTKAVAGVKSKEQKIDLIIKIARIAIDLKQYDKAIEILKSCPRDKKFVKKLYVVDLTVINCYEAEKQLDYAMALTNQMLANRLYGEHFSELTIKKASILAEMGKFDDAISAYKSVTDLYSPSSVYQVCFTKDSLAKRIRPDTSLVKKTDSTSNKKNDSTSGSIKSSKDVSAAKASALSKSYTGKSSSTPESNSSTQNNNANISKEDQAAAGFAWFEMGNIYVEPKNDFIKAKECLLRSLVLLQDSAAKIDAQSHIKSLDSLFILCLRLDTIDTVKGSLNRNNIDIRLGELFWLELNMPDSACAHFRHIAAYKDSLRPKALYSIFYIERNAMKDTAGSDSVFRTLLSEYPANEYSKKAQKDRGDSITVHTRQDSASFAYMAAESLFCVVDEPEAAVVAFDSVYAKFPDCQYGRTALYASAWISDDVLKNNKTAYRQYRLFCDSFPTCDICTNAIKPKLKTVSDTLAARKARKKTGENTAKASKTSDRQKKQSVTSMSRQVKDTASLSKNDSLENNTVNDVVRKKAVENPNAVSSKQIVKSDSSARTRASSISEDTSGNIKSVKALPKTDKSSGVKSAGKADSLQISSVKTAQPGDVRDSSRIEPEEPDDTVEVIGQTSGSK
jgi:tetratricopeptide (TPR) repeat protein